MDNQREGQSNVSPPFLDEQVWDNEDYSSNVLAFMVKTDDCYPKKNSDISASQESLNESDESDTSDSDDEEDIQEKFDVLQDKYDELYQQSLMLAKQKAKALSKLNKVENEKEALKNEVENQKSLVTELEKMVETLKKNEELVERQVLSLEHISTDQQLADMFTKPLEASRFEYLRSSLGVILLE